MSVRTAPIVLSFAPPSRGVTFSTKPSGARVVVDGRDSGFVTPCALRIDKGDWHRIDLALRGYRTETRIVRPDWGVYTLKWNDMDHFGPRNFRFPFWLGLGEILLPVRYVSRSIPARLHVEMRVLEPGLELIDSEPLDVSPLEPVDPAARRAADPDQPSQPAPRAEEEPALSPEEQEVLELLKELGYIDEPPADTDEPERR